MFNKYINYKKFSSDLKNIKNTSKNDMRYTDKNYTIDKNINKNMESLKIIFGSSDDIIYREFTFGVNKEIKAILCFVDGLVDKVLMDEYIMKSLMLNIHIDNYDPNLDVAQNMFYYIKNFVINAVELEEIDNFDKCIGSILDGNSILFIDGSKSILSISTKGGETRKVTQLEAEVSIRGPRVAFTESLRVNTSLLRRVIKSPDLIFESLILGKKTNTDITIAYLKGVSDLKVVKEVKRRLNNIQINAILESGYIEQLIDDNPYSPFATIGNSEKPEKVASKLLQGRVAIFCNGTPFVLTVPYLFTESIQVLDDYSSRPISASVIRLIRCIAFFITIALPALFVSFASFHQEIVPTVFLVATATSRQGVPFPVFLEAIFTELTFQLLRESGIRMPRAVGAAVSIVGTLIIGDAAVNAHIVSAPMVIVVALSGITSFIIPTLFDALLIFRFILLVLSGLFGLFGVAIGLLFMLTHLCSLESFGTPFMSPFAPLNWYNLKDTLVRLSIKYGGGTGENNSKFESNYKASSNNNEKSSGDETS